MARNDVYLNINALSPADAVVTGQQDMTSATVPELVLGDTPTFNFYFTDNTNVWPSWAGNAAYTVTWALSDAVSGDFSPAATTGNATPITGGWSVVLPLNSYDLVGLLNTKRVSQPYPVTNLWQQIRVADPSGNEVTRAMFWTPIRYRAISDTQNTESASPTGGREVTVDNVNVLTTPTAAQFYAANPVPTSALGSAANGELLIGNGTGFTKATLTAGSGVSITNGSGSITISATDGDITLDDGTAAAPSLKFTADTDTGIYRPSDNVVGISAGGVSRATFGATSAINGTTIPASKTLVVTTDKLSALAATTSAELAGVISDETGSGALVFANTPTLVTPNIGAATGTSFNLTGSGTLGTTLTVNGTTDSSSKDTGAIITEGGLGVEKSASIGGNLTVSGTGGVTASASFVPITALGTSGSSGTFVSDGHLNDLQGNTSQHFLIKRAKSTTTQSRWAFQLQGGENPSDSPVGGSELVFAYSTAATGTFTNALSLTRTGNATLSGNLTVSGNGLNTFGGTGTTNASILFGASNVANTSAGYLSISQRSNYGYALFGWNMTGTSGSDAYTSPKNATGSAGVELIGGSSGITRFIYSTAATTGGNTLTVTEAARFSSGNLLLKSDGVDSGNGKLQLATHTTSAGGIGFGTDVALYRSSANTLKLELGVSSGALLFDNGGLGTGGARVLGTSGALTVTSNGANSLYLQTGGTTALTLDSSQNATFAKTISAGTTITANGASTDVAIGVTLTGANARAWQWRIDSATGNLRLLDATASSYPITFLGNAAGVTIGSQYNGGLTANTQSYGSHVFQCGNVDKLTVADTKITISPTTASTSTTTGALVVSGGVGVAGAVNVGGAIAIGNTVNTVSPTSPNRTITMVIGGTTYYIHAKTTND